MNMEPLREFVSLGDAQEGLRCPTEGHQAKARQTGRDHHPHVHPVGRAMMTVAVDGTKRTLAIYQDVYASPAHDRGEVVDALKQSNWPVCRRELQRQLAHLTGV